MPDLPVGPRDVLGLLGIGGRLAAGALRLGGSILREAADLLDGLVGAGGQSAGGPDAGPEDRDEIWDGPGQAAPAAGVAVPPEPLEPEPEPLEPPAPDHVSEEPVLVAESADPEAIDGAGAELHVEEPWSGYAQMTAAEIIDRLPAQPPEALAVVEMYERMHRGRRSVLEAAERALQG